MLLTGGGESLLYIAGRSGVESKLRESNFARMSTFLLVCIKIVERRLLSVCKTIELLSNDLLYAGHIHTYVHFESVLMPILSKVEKGVCMELNLFFQ